MKWYGLLLLLFLLSCTQQVVCNTPYMQVGLECCLDQDDNSICDRDEIVEEDTQQVLVQAIIEEDELEDAIKVKCCVV